MDALLREQWDRLVAWLVDEDVESKADLPSDLPGWTIGDLVAHLGYGIAMIAEIEPAPVGTAPLSVARYVAGYRGAASAIEVHSHQLRRRLEPTLVEGIQAMADEAWASLENQRSEVVVGRRGPLTLRDYLLTRVIELVIHADDLERSIGAVGSSPVSADALLAVSDALSAAHFEMRGIHPVVEDSRAWIRRASGRTPWLDGDPPVLG